MERGIVVRIGAAVLWATAVSEALSVQVVNLPFPDVVASFLTLNWTHLGFEAVFLASLTGLQLKYRQRTPWYIWLIGSCTALAFFCWQLLPMLLTQWVYLKSGYKGLEDIYYRYSIEQMRSILFAIYIVYTAGMLVWGASALLKGVLPRWTAMLLMLFGVDSLLRWPVIPNEGPFLFPGFNVLPVPIVAFGTPYIFVRCMLLIGLGCALWVQNRPGRESVGQIATGATPERFAEGVDPAV